MVERVAIKEKYREARLFNARASVAGLCIVLAIGLLLWRYFELQIISNEIYRTQSERNRVQLQPIAPKRGLIVDRNGILLAENRPSHSLTIVKERTSDLEQTIALLRELVVVDETEIEKFYKRVSRRRPYQPIPLKLGLTEEEIAIIGVNRHRMPGVDVDAELVRHYPQGELFAHVLGYVGRISEAEAKKIDPVNYSGSHSIGKIGLEKFYENYLHGTVGYQNVETNARGRVLRVLERESPKPGENLRLHIDTDLQQVAYEALGAERGAVVAIDPNNGGVLAMVSTPSFDTNLFVTGISSKDYRGLRESPDLPLFNRALQGQYPPGSTVKPVYGLAGLQYGLVTPHTTVLDPGWYKLPNDDRLYRDWKRTGHGLRVNLHQAVAESCDTYFYDLAYELGIDRIHEFSAPFGLGRVTGIDNTNERRGLLPSREWKRKTRRQPWFPGETLNVGIGQGYMLATPLQLAVMTATIATRGQYYQPFLVASISGKERVSSPVAIPEVAEAHWDVVIDSMRAVVHEVRGTAHRISENINYTMAGKTGTAQVVGIAQGEKYDAEKLEKLKHDHALFVGFAPLDNPQIAVAVIVENGGSGSATAAPIARKVFDEYLLTEAEKQQWQYTEKKATE